MEKATNEKALWSGVDLTTSPSSTWLSIQKMDNVSFQVSWNGSSPVGTFFVDVSNDPLQVTYDTLTLSGTPSTSGSSGVHTIALNQVPFSFVRIRFAYSSGTGTLNCNAEIKQLG